MQSSSTQPLLNPQADSYRDAFTFSTLHVRRDAGRITCLALDTGASSVFLGLADGHLEEYRFSDAPAELACRLVASKRISRRELSALVPLPNVRQLAALAADGSVALVAADTLAALALPQAKGATALAVDQSSGPLCRLAVALAAGSVNGRRTSRVQVYMVAGNSSAPSGPSSSRSPAVQVQLLTSFTVEGSVSSLAWLGEVIFMAVPGGYKAFSNLTIVDIAPGVTSRTLLAPLPSAEQAVLLFNDTVLLITDARGAAVREPLQLPESPLAVAASGSMFLLAALEDGLHVYEAASCQRVQHVRWAHDDPYVQMRQQLPMAADAAADLAGGAAAATLVFATSSSVYCLQPVPLEQQARQLLKHKKFRPALRLIRQAAATAAAASPPHGGQQGQQQQQALKNGTAVAPAHPPWIRAALCQAGLLLLQDCDWAAAIEALLQVPPPTFQPAMLLALFPAIASRWARQVQAASSAYWGLHGAGLTDLQALVDNKLELGESTAAAPGSRAGSGAGGGVGAAEGDDGRQAGDAGGAGQQRTARASHSGRKAAAESLVREAHLHLAAYFLAARKRCDREWGASAGAPPASGLICADGIDTLLVRLLAEGDDVAALECFVCGPHQQAAAADVRDALRAASRWHALALFESSQGRPQEALEVWRQLAEGAAVEAPCSSSSKISSSGGGGSAAAAALGAACDLLCAPDKTPAQLALSNLPWLLRQSPSSSHALRVLMARHDLPARQVLAMLGDGNAQHGEVAWQYLFHMVHELGSQDAGLHTQLALLLVARLVKAAAEQGGAQAKKAASSQQPEAEAALRQQQEAAMEEALQRHLEQSDLYDAQAVLRAAEGSRLHRAQAALHCRLGQHGPALRLLAIALQDVDGAIAYCKAHGGPGSWMTLLDLFLRADQHGAPAPMYSAAIQVLAVEGADLDPLQVLAALSDDMPLALAHDTLARMLSSVTHRRRQLQMVKALHRAQAVALRLQRVDWLSQRVVVTEDSACHACKRLLGHTYRQHVFMRHPTGVILCTRCGKSAQQQQQQPGPGSLAPEPATVSLAAGSGSPSQGGG